MENYYKIGFIVDMVVGFVEKGNMHDKYIAHTIDEQVSLIEKLKKEKQAVALIGEWHEKNSTEFLTYPEHCVIGTDEVNFVDRLRNYENSSLVYRKNSTNGIFAPGLLEDIDKMKNLKEIIICGCCTDICVLHFVISLKNYLDQNNRNIKIFVVESATETYDAPNHNREEYNEIAYRFMRQNGIEVVKNIKELEERENQLFSKRGGR